MRSKWVVSAVVFGLWPPLAVGLMWLVLHCVGGPVNAYKLAAVSVGPVIVGPVVFVLGKRGLAAHEARSRGTSDGDERR